VRLRGRVSEETIVGALGDVADPNALLRDAAAAGFVLHRDGRLAGWSLTPDGRQEHAERLREDRERAAAGDVVADGYARFRAINEPFLGVCTRWQVRPDGAPNDHTDTAYDRAVLDELAAVDETAQAICADLAAVLERFGPYGPRLAAARARVGAGDGRWFASPALDSYHTVWFELHEDLLLTLGLERGDGR
jgi:hypothetical protein